MSAPKLTEAQILALVWYSWPCVERDIHNAPDPRVRGALLSAGAIHFQDGAYRLTHRGEMWLRGEPLTPAGRAALEGGGK